MTGSEKRCPATQEFNIIIFSQPRTEIPTAYGIQYYLNREIPRLVRRRIGEVMNRRRGQVYRQELTLASDRLLRGMGVTVFGFPRVPLTSK